MTATHSVEFTVLQNLLTNEEYTRKVLPFLKSEYFKNESDKIVYKIIDKFFTDYNKLPTREVLAISLQEKHGVPEKVFEETKRLIDEFSDSSTVDVRWATDLAEKFCKERALYNAITQSILIADGQDKKHGPGAIPSILQEALSVSFDSDIGHEYLESAELRFKLYNEHLKKIRFSHDIMNQATSGGFDRQDDHDVRPCGRGLGSGSQCSLHHNGNGRAQDRRTDRLQPARHRNQRFEAAKES